MTYEEAKGMLLQFKLLKVLLLPHEDLVDRNYSQELTVTRRAYTLYTHFPGKQLAARVHTYTSIPELIDETGICLVPTAIELRVEENDVGDGWYWVTSDQGLIQNADL